MVRGGMNRTRLPYTACRPGQPPLRLVAHARRCAERQYWIRLFLATSSRVLSAARTPAGGELYMDRSRPRPARVLVRFGHLRQEPPIRVRARCVGVAATFGAHVSCNTQKGVSAPRAQVRRA